VGLFYSLLPLLAGDCASNLARVVSQFGLTGQRIVVPTNYSYEYVGGINPLTGAALPQQPGTTPRNLTWNVLGEQELRRNILVRLNYIDSHTTYLFVANPFTAPADINLFGGEIVAVGDRVLGRVTSGGYGYTVGRNICCAYVAASEPAHPEYAVEVMGTRHPAQRHIKALYDPERQRIVG
jgi:hypothetical protein